MQYKASAQPAMELDASLSWLAWTLTPGLECRLYDPPVLFCLRGAPQILNLPSVNVVGTRRPTRYGTQMAERLGRDLAARGLVILRGMARGIDAMAASLRTVEKKLYDLLSTEYTRHVDDLIEESGLTSSEVLATLFDLEMKGVVRQLPGKQFSKVMW